MSKRIIVLPEELEVIEQRLSKIENVLKHEQHQVEDPILGTEELMALLKVSRRTVQSWRDAGLIEFSAVKSKFYYRMSAINKLLNSNQICCN
jgi:hypothetical protein